MTGAGVKVFSILTSNRVLKLILVMSVTVLAVGNFATTFSPHSESTANYGHRASLASVKGLETSIQDKSSTLYNTKPSSQNLMARPHSTPLPTPPTGLVSSSTIPPAIYDEQLGTTFTQNFNSLSYNVTAIAQSDSNGYGPAYLLNGLTTSGYWYQVGIAYDWPFTSGGYNPGFYLIYAVFDSSQKVVLPSAGGAGLSLFSGPGISGDPVQLTLKFSNGNVVMAGKDMKTGGSASVSYSDKGASSFTGSPFSISNSNGFFTGLMTEWYHADPYFGNEEGITYSNRSSALSSAWMWMDEFDVANRFWNGAFSASTSSAVTYSPKPDQFQSFASHGAVDTSNAHEFVTGQMPCGPSTTLAADTVVCNGLGPRTIGLNWGQSGYGSLFFSGYEVQQSTTGPDGNWTVIDSQGPISNTTDYVQNLTPGKTYWWREIDHSSVGLTATSNVLEIQQPNGAILSYAPLSDSAYRLTWTNNATYSGLVAFDSYQLEESANGGSYSLAQTILSASSSNFTLNGLSSDTNYSFYVVTGDKCVGCSGSLTSSTASNHVSLKTPSALLVSASSQRSSADVNQTISFTCSTDGGVLPYTYSWTFGDGLTGVGQIVTHAYSLPGTMRVKCTVTDGLQTNATALAISLNIANAPLVLIGVNRSSADVGQTVEFTSQVTGGSGGYSFNWLHLPLGCGSSSSSSVTCQSITAGSYVVSLNITDSNAFSVVSYGLPLTVYADPSIAAFTTSPNNLDLGQTTTTVVLATVSYGALSYSYSGFPSGCTTTNSPTFTCDPSVAGHYLLVVTVTDLNGFTVANGPVSLTVNSYPTTSLQANPSDLDLGQTVTLTISVTGGTGSFSYSYLTLPPGCSSSNTPNLACQPSQIGQYTIQTIATDQLGVTVMSSATLTVNADPTISSFMPSSAAIDVGQKVTLTVSANLGTGTLTYSYSGLPPGCSSANSAHLSCAPSTSGSYEVQVIVTDQTGKSSTSSLSINVNPQTLFGLPLLVGYSVIAGIVVAALALSISVLRSRKTRAQSKPS
jgi:hypothetical protein